MISDARGTHVSPGIYTDERDVTYSVKSLGITSLGLVGETLYGPAFQNIEISNWGEYVDYFGGTSSEKDKYGNPKYELPYVAKSYLEESKRLNVVRVLGLSGYKAGKAWVIYNEYKPAIVLRSKLSYTSTSGNCGFITEEPNEIVKDIEFVKYESKVYTSNCEVTSSGTVEENTDKFGLKVTTNENISKVYYVSLNPSDSDYIYNVISNNPSTGTTDIYIEALYESSLSGITIQSAGTVNSFSGLTDYQESYRAAQTPWIVSDALVTESENNGETEKTGNVKKLFKFYTISDGNVANYQVKVTLQNIDVVKGTFDVVVRDFNDTDANQIILETFRKCTLVEGDSSYIAYKIGTIDGGFESKSKYILVEMAEGEDLRNAIPAGFMGYPMPKYGDDDKAINLLYNGNFEHSVKPKRQCFGFSDRVGIDVDVFSYKGNLNSGNTIYTNGFHMDSLMDNCAVIYVDGESGTCNFSTVSENNTTVGKNNIPRLIKSFDYIKQTIYSDINTCKFTVCFYGGFDGWDINRTERTNTNDFKSTKYNASSNGVIKPFINESEGNLPLNLPSTANTSDYYAYLAGVRVFSNPQDIDINILATPGINWYDNALLTQEILDIVEDSEDGRGGDALYIMASPNTEDVDDVISKFEEVGINSSYACTYFPWIMYYDNANMRYLNLPVTKDVVRNMASIDNKSYPWFAPAGTERGIVNCVKANVKTRLADEDALYEVGINPVKTFAQDGVKIWGNKTAYSVESPLNRINVRRLMIRVKKMITDAAKHLIFEQYDATLEKQFRGLVEPILADVKSNRGIIDYRVITECTPETRDQHILPARILIKPTQSLEYISISFVVYPESVSFENE